MNYSRLMNYLWRAGHFTGRETVAVTGERVMVVSGGEPDDDTPGVWRAAEVTVDGERRRGCVAVGEDTSVPDSAVLRVVGSSLPPVLGVDDRLVTQIECPPPAGAARCYDALRAGAV